MTQFELRILKVTSLDSVQIKLCSVFYWAAYYGDIEVVTLFLVKLGLSPFIKIFRGRSVINACIEGK